MNDEVYLLFGIKDGLLYYISNTNPILWTPNSLAAKIYYDRYKAEYSILRDYDNYRHISKQIESDSLDAFYLGIYQDGTEVGRVKLL